MSAYDVGVAISTTGDEHRLELLAKTVAGWRATLAEIIDWQHNPNIFVTIDGDEDACGRVMKTLSYEPVQFFRVGQSWGVRPFHEPRDGRLGVAVNKNTGIELLMDAGVQHLFLSDDDIYPKTAAALDLHINSALDHSMVCWGYHRLGWTSNGDWAEWDWPRGSMLYAHRSVVNATGGMVEEFGPGGHEHVEWSRRIFQSGLTPALFPTPKVYAYEDAQHGQSAMKARDYWVIEDMPQPREPIGNFRLRKNRITSVRRRGDDWEKIEKIMRDRDGVTAFVPYQSEKNGRGSATLYHNHRA